ncbi:MAG: ABC transporter ATP-binding protein [Smithellaceae bacterium]|jgi:branched-chain amino acid transport system ATP-binding protein
MGIFQFKNVSKVFGGLRAIDDVSFSIDQGEIIGLIGPNGAGKTTIFSLASGFTPPTSGKIFFKENRIDGLASDQICKKGLCRTFQVVKPFGDMNVLDNIMVGSLLHTANMKKAQEEALEILYTLGLVGVKEQMGKNLTIADRKRLEIARALATHPKMILLDEVMAGLTSVETREVIEMIRQIQKRNITILLIEHIMQAIMSLSDRIIVIHHGQKISEGNPKAVSNDEQVIKAYLGEEYHELT